MRRDGHLGGARARRGITETGSFGKSTRRSRSRTGTPARQRDHPTLTAADKVFGDWMAQQQSAPASTTTTPNRKNLLNGTEDAAAAAKGNIVQSEPTEVILRGYRNAQHQYAAINHYEQLAGRICEDYPRQPPVEHRRYKSELRDPAFLRRKPLSPEERAKVNRAAGGENWVKITFESAEAAEAAMYSSPQSVLGHLVYAELYHNRPPAKDEPIPDMEAVEDHHSRSKSVPAFGHTPERSRRPASTMPNPFASNSPTGSRNSSATMDTATLSTGRSTTISAATITEVPTAQTTVTEAPADDMYCRRISTARKIKMLPAEQALLPQQTLTQRIINTIPFLKWFSGSMIGNEVPRTELGEFDWNKASLYWKMIWYLDYYLRIFQGEIAYGDKED